MADEQWNSCEGIMKFEKGKEFTKGQGVRTNKGKL